MVRILWEPALQARVVRSGRVRSGQVQPGVAQPGVGAIMIDRGGGAIVALMLAAGCSRRFGSDKRRVRLASGHTLLQASMAPVLAAGLPLYVVLRPGDDFAELGGCAMDAALPPAQCIVAPRAEEGMGASLADAVAALPESVAGCLVLLADMPALKPATLRRIAAALAEDGEEALVAPGWQGRRGHPVGFGRAWFDQLAQLDGDRGARELLQREAERLRLLPVDDPGILLDIDTVADLLRC